MRDHYFCYFQTQYLFRIAHLPLSFLHLHVSIWVNFLPEDLLLGDQASQQ